VTALDHPLSAPLQPSNVDPFHRKIAASGARGTMTDLQTAPFAPLPPVTKTAPDDGMLAISPGAWRASKAIILITGAFLRLIALTLVPFHHDEGVNGNFLLQLVRENFYRYDPENYHGPSLYYISAVFPWILKLIGGSSAAEKYGLTSFGVRFVTAAFGIGTIALVFLLRRRIGTLATLTAATLLTLSPGAVYLSRYFIHESLLVFFTLAAILAALKFYDSASSGYLLLAAGLTALIFATKETAIITAGVLVIALVSTLIFVRLRKMIAERNETQTESEASDFAAKLRAQVTRFGGPGSLFILAVAALSVFLIVNVLLYSSFFTNYPQGLYDSLKAFQVWTRTGTQLHVQPWTKYFVWMWQKETAVLILGWVGIGFALWYGRNRFAIFSALWAFGIILAYSLIPYKTPWLMLNFVLPLSITGGYAVEKIYALTKSKNLKVLAPALLAAAVCVSGDQTISLNFFRYDDPSAVYPYAHTFREFMPLLDQIKRAVQAAGTGDQTEIAVTSTEYWPLPWYLRQYPNIRFYGRLMAVEAPIVVGTAPQTEELITVLGPRYALVMEGAGPGGVFPMRPGVGQVLFVRRDLLKPRAP
jgi:uncharacterized protein (TIGR03663 family)